MRNDPASLVLRLAGPLQSWSSRSQFNRRDTAAEPTKSGIIGLLAAAHGRRRVDPIDDLLALRLGVRTDEPGTLLRDYHTVSDYRGRPLLSAAVTARGAQKPTSPAKATHVTERYYLQDAVFVAAVAGEHALLEGLREALQRPAFPLCLGRRSCVPTQPIVVDPGPQDAHDAYPLLWAGEPAEVLARVPWTVPGAQRRRLERLARAGRAPGHVDLPVSIDDPAGRDLRIDLPSTFAPHHRSFSSRRVRQDWVRMATPYPGRADDEGHDPFDLLGW